MGWDGLKYTFKLLDLCAHKNIELDERINFLPIVLVAYTLETIYVFHVLPLKVNTEVNC